MCRPDLADVFRMETKLTVAEPDADDHELSAGEIRPRPVRVIRIYFLARRNDSSTRMVGLAEKFQ